MKKIFISMLCLCLPLMGFTVTPRGQRASNIRLNSIGYLPTAPKQASIVGKKCAFNVVNAKTGKVVFRGSTSAARYQKDINQSVCTADFSKITKPGSYYLTVNGRRSATFNIGDKVYTQPLITTMRAFYLWRCGMAVTGKHNGQTYHYDACHLNDGYEDYIGQKGTIRDGVGGWHDAGDYGKYIVNAGITLGCLFRAYESFSKQLSTLPLDLPQTAEGYPQFLQELKWETDWLLKMQYADGSGRVSHKLTRREFSWGAMPEKDLEKRFYTDWSSAATANFVASLAQAARVFQPYDAAYAKKCLDAARLSYQCLKKHPEEKPFVQGDFKTGGYQTTDPDDRLWAAAELWETTGEAQYLKDFETRSLANRNQVDKVWDWGNVTNLGTFTYLLSKRSGRNPQIAEQLHKAAIASADEIVADGLNDVYRRPLGTSYGWGCNGTVARQTINLYVAYRLTGKADYRTTALDAVAHLFGRNYYGRSFVTGLGVNPALYPHDRRSAFDENKAPWPGYVVGGGLSATNWKDDQGEYSLNEIAINWQAPVVFALAFAAE